SPTRGRLRGSSICRRAGSPSPVCGNARGSDAEGAEGHQTYESPFMRRLESARDQAERRFVSFGSLVWVGTALSADWMRPYAQTAIISRLGTRDSRLERLTTRARKGREGVRRRAGRVPSSCPFESDAVFSDPRPASCESRVFRKRKDSRRRSGRKSTG